jgi:phenylacetate-CoA ligase
MESRYYDPEIETSSRDGLRKIQTMRLQKVVKHAWDFSPFYRRKFEEANVTPDRIRSMEDVSKLPFVTKEDLRKNQEASPPWGDVLTLAPEECQRIHLTSGTTGKPLRILDTAEDWAKFCHIYARNLYAYGIRKIDMAMPAFSFGPWIGFWAGYYA